MSSRSPRDEGDQRDRRSAQRAVAERRALPAGSESTNGGAGRDSDPDRREHRRHRVANLKVKGPIAGEVINTSHLGVAIETNESLTVGWSYAFRMRNGPEVIRIPGKVKWCRLVQLLRVGDDEFLPVFRMGVQMAGNLWGKPQLHYYP